MVSPIYGVKFEKSGYAVVLRERPDLGTDELDYTNRAVLSASTLSCTL